ncbi:hypothetical protein JCM11251_002520 [Rhodosporidiobolus azoricus]
MFASLLGGLANAVSGSGAAAETSADSTSSSTPSSSAPSSSTSSPSPATAPAPDNSHGSPTVPIAASSLPGEPCAPDLEDLALDSDPRFDSSGYFQRLLKRGGHHPNRIRAIKRAALKDLPPVEPQPWECCGGGCGIECVVTVWWEEEKTWRDMHPDDWKDIKRRLKEEEEDRKREEEEEAALRRDDGDPEVVIGLEGDEQEKVQELSGKVDGLAIA